MPFGRTLRTLEQVERSFGAPVLAQIPHLHVRPGLKTIEGESERATAFRRLRSNVAELARAGGFRVILVTSNARREGKSVVAAHLAVGLAQTGAATLAVDAELDRPQLGSLLGAAIGGPGLTGVLAGVGSLAEAVHDVSVDPVGAQEASLAFLPRGASHDSLETLLSAPSLEAVLGPLRGRYGHVVLNGPPLTASDLVLEIARASDGVLLVVRRRHTTVQEAGRVRETLDQAGIRLAGVVFTDAGEAAGTVARPAPAERERRLEEQARVRADAARRAAEIMARHQAERTGRLVQQLTEATQRHEELSRREQELEEQVAALEAEQQRHRREVLGELSRRDQQMDVRAAALTADERALGARGAELDARVAERERELTEREAALAARLAELESREAELAARLDALSAREKRLVGLVAEASQRQRELAERAAAVERRAEEVAPGRAGARGARGRNRERPGAGARAGRRRAGPADRRARGRLRPAAGRRPAVGGAHVLPGGSARPGRAGRPAALLARLAGPGRLRGAPPAVATPGPTIRVMRFRLAVVVLLAFLASTANAATAPVTVTVIAPTHNPKANAPWPVTIRVDSGGPPPRAKLTMRILLGGMEVGKVDNGKVWTFRRSWREPKGQEITWPASARGAQFVFQAKVTVLGRTYTKNVPVTVR
jgi:Mrp family chromosome partitioning ATPase